MVEPPGNLKEGKITFPGVDDLEYRVQCIRASPFGRRSDA